MLTLLDRIIITLIFLYGWYVKSHIGLVQFLFHYSIFADQTIIFRFSQYLPLLFSLAAWSPTINNQLLFDGTQVYTMEELIIFALRLSFD